MRWSATTSIGSRCGGGCLPDPARFARVAERDGLIVGFLSAGPDERGCWELTALYVLPEAFGEGIGSRLHDEFVAQLAGGPAELEVWDGNDRAKRFYRDRDWVAANGHRDGPAGRPFVRCRREGAE
ncbi:GNAT family N-acetyltransferase [Microbacterium elymi]|uniref:GNAT family N-acetyltransferase n=1 Tax=Microbacterium elymi TaxID=2909587 RepID=A0ABY5NKA0_9MICO|nr:GNAT family N-acetyltransferase [Microbacterium elymi]UUT35549.1 GNAT family N-acetyltransferase [Microbacterium elymi]